MDSETDKDIKKQQKDIGKVPHFGEVDWFYIINTNNIL